MRNTLLGILFLVAAVSSQAAELFVFPNGTGTYANIQAAVDGANPGDTIYLMPGTFTGPGNRDIESDFSLTITSNDINNPAVIDCQGSAATPHRGFLVNDGTLVLDHLIIRNGYATSGGAMYLSGPQTTVTYCVIEDCTATGSGGAVYADGPDLVHIDHTVFAGNSAGTQGGAVYNGPGALLRLYNCTLVRN